MGEEYHGVNQTLVERLGTRRGETVYAFFACLLALGVSGLAAYASKQSPCSSPRWDRRRCSSSSSRWRSRRARATP